MTKILQKPRECRNKNCVAMCSPAWAEFWFDKPDCPNYVRGEDRPIGHWILDESDNSIECDKCECVIYANDIIGGEPHYCPNCGAKMK